MVGIILLKLLNFLHNIDGVMEISLLSFLKLTKLKDAKHN